MTHKKLLIIPALLAAIAVPQFVSARENAGIKRTIIPPAINAACTSPTVQSDFAVNNVRCRLLLSDMWWNLSGGRYEIPKGGGVHSMFAGALWIGGIDAGGQLKVAAQTYRQTGTDFWPGPLNTSDASVNSEVCNQYDKHFKITRKEVEAFAAGGVPTTAITDWPGNGDVSKGQDPYLAPFFDKNADGVYSPSAGDYPGYDLVKGDGYGECITVNCTPVDQLFGDETIWWVFNDNGNVHGETKGQPIGLEIRAQAFGFATDDEINNMTFYNYRIFNRSTFKVDSCYFGVWSDPDLGDAVDDFVGCDVARGLGYTYNGDNDDDAGAGGYGLNPPAIGMDYFRGPIADANDGKDNDRNCITDEPCEQNIMSGFLYYNNANGVANGNPANASHFYNYLKMKWGDNSHVKFGGDGFSSATGPECNFMFPGNPTTDTHDWGLAATVATCSTSPTLGNWNELLAGNTPDDRRMLLNAGPFTLKPGAVNVITTGVVWARTTSGGALASVKLLQAADDKAQALFDNCFQVLDGPDAPDVTVQELDKEIILYLSNTNSTSNNYKEGYYEYDPLIALLDSANNPIPGIDTTYNFEGYKIYQVKDPTVTGNDLDNADKARLVAQSDIKNDSAIRIINYEFDQVIGASVPKIKVNGSNTGISHSIRITSDAFSSGSPALVNHKTYYYLALAYGYNEFKKYLLDAPPSASDPFAPAYDGQKKPYKQGRKNIKVYSAIPHNVSPYNGGNEAHASYGAMPAITRIEGNGNGGMALELTSASINAILNSSNNLSQTLTYEAGMGPLNVKVIDPLNVPDGHNFTLKFNSATSMANSTWKLKNNTTGEEIGSDKTIKTLNEQLFMQWGLAVSILQPTEPGTPTSINNGYLTSSITFADPSKKWFSGLADTDAPSYENWIRSGTIPGPSYFIRDFIGLDDGQYYEKMVGGTWAPYRLTMHTDPNGTPPVVFINPKTYYTGPQFKRAQAAKTLLKNIASVNVVLTSDKSKWSRCVVLEMAEDSLFSKNTSGEPRKARKHDYRRALSVDKDGSTATGSDNNDYATGMGWFPGYAINVETGERLNIAYGENSALTNENGNDMKWNPTGNKYASNYNLPWDTVGHPYDLTPVFGGQHYIYVFGNNNGNDVNTPTIDTLNIPRYDKGKRMRQILSKNNGHPADLDMAEIFKDAMWVNIPLLASGHQLLETEVTVKLRVSKPYKKAYTGAVLVDVATTYVDTSSTPQNNNLPMYTFSTDGIAAHNDHKEVAVEALDLINVVPNPYYAYSDYEKSSLYNQIKITNLPEVCTVSIYNLGGTLIRKLKKGEIIKTHSAQNTEVTYDGGSVVLKTWDGSLDWDLKNTAGIPISSGVYVIHVEVPGVGERVIKWFGIMRPIEIDAF